MPRTVLMLLCAAALGAVPAVAQAKGPLVEPDEGPDPRGLTLSGSGLAYVAAPPRPSEATIRRAVEAAKPHATGRAVEQARTRAQALAAAAGLTLGDVQAVTERDRTAEGGFYEERYCGSRRRPRCRVPLFTVATVTVTFATVQTSAAAPAGRALISDGIAQARVRPSSRRDSASIRAAMLRAQFDAAPGALAAARRDAESLARRTGMPLGSLFSVAELRRPFEQPLGGSFGPGRFCGTIRRPVFRRDPATGRRRVVRRVSERRCFFPSTTTVALRLTFLP
jgi:hypothetical protein